MIRISIASVILLACSGGVGAQHATQARVEPAYGQVSGQGHEAVSGGLPFGFVHHGNFKRMTHLGDARGQVALSDLPRASGAWGLGATAELEGEIIQLDGKLLVSRGTDPQGRVEPPEAGAQAALFAGAQVAAWHDVPVPRDMDQGQSEAFVAAQAEALGLSLKHPFVFRIEGSFPTMVWHVVTGAKPTVAAHGTQGHQATQAGAHANQQSGMRVFRQPGVKGQLVGVYSGSNLEGIVSHPWERFHAHFVDDGVRTSGHVDAYSIAAGAVLRLPVR